MTDNTRNITFNLKLDTVNKILNEIGKMKFKLVHQLVTKLQTTTTVSADIALVSLTQENVEFIVNEILLELSYVTAAPLIKEITEAFNAAAANTEIKSSEVNQPVSTKIVEVSDSTPVTTDALNDR